MKLSSPTISVLKSFSAINPNLLIRAGTKLATKNATGSMQARAVVDESFPQELAIYDLNKFLSLVSISSDPDIEFGENSLTIVSANGGMIEYFYAEKELIASPPDTELTVDPVFSFVLTNGDMTTIQKTSSIVAATMISVDGKGSDVTLKISNPKEQTSNNYRKKVGTSPANFSMRMSIDNFRPIVDDTYDVTLGSVTGKAGNKVPVFQFVSQNRNLKYLIAAETSSKI